MVRFLLGFSRFFLLLSAAGALSGYLIAPGMVGLVPHVVVALTGVLGAILACSLVMFYFIGTGSTIKEAARRGLISMEEYQASRRFKGTLFPLIMGAIALLMVEPVLGAAFDAKKLGLVWHHVGAWVTLAFFWWLIGRFDRLLAANTPLYDRAYELVEEAKAKEETVRGNEGE